jgi:membrane protein DedA with SNARE-associated domain
MPRDDARKGLSRTEILILAVGLPLAVVAIILAKPLVADVLNRILNLDPTMVYVVVAVLVFAEAAVFFGFIFPGETAVILGGVVASNGRVNVVVLGTLVVVAAIVGDSVGYIVGHTWGDRVLKLKLLEERRGGIDRALGLLRTRGAVAVFIGRFTAFLRAVVPGLAGLSRMRYRTFLAANAAGGIVWGLLFTLLGYLLGSAYHKAEKYAGWASSVLLIVLLVVAIALFIRNRLSEKQLESDFAAEAPDEDARIAEDLAKTREVLEADED